MTGRHFYKAEEDPETEDEEYSRHLPENQIKIEAPSDCGKSYADASKMAPSVQNPPANPIKADENNIKYWMDPIVPQTLASILKRGLKKFENVKNLPKEELLRQMTEKELQNFERIWKLKEEGLRDSNYRSYLSFLIYAEAYQVSIS